MTDSEILHKAIQKASKNGYPPYEQWGSWRDIVFDHNFAKAFWGEHQFTDCTKKGCNMPNHSWKFHLQQMVLEENPIQYLEQFLD